MVFRLPVFGAWWRILPGRPLERGEDSTNLSINLSVGCCWRRNCILPARRPHRHRYRSCTFDPGVDLSVERPTKVGLRSRSLLLKTITGPSSAITWRLVPSASDRQRRSENSRGDRVEEHGYDHNGRCVAEVDPCYFRPTEANNLLRYSSKASTQLGWLPSVEIESSEIMIHDVSETK